MPTWGWIVLVVGLLLAAGVVVDRLLLAAEARGWIFYRRRKASRTALGSAMMSILEIYAPEQHHVVEERKRFDAEEEADGDPPDPS